MPTQGSEIPTPGVCGHFSFKEQIHKGLLAFQDVATMWQTLLQCGRRAAPRAQARRRCAVAAHSCLTLLDSCLRIRNILCNST